MAKQVHEIDLESQAEEAEEEGFDFERLKRVAGFFLRAPRRRPRLALGALALGLLLTFLVAKFWPRVYEADVRILTQRNLVLPALGNPNRAVPRDADNPTRNVADIILQRDNIIALVKQVNLVDRWATSRPPAMRLKDRLWASLFGEISDEDRVRGFVGYLEKQLTVAADDTTITITVAWPDPQLAFEIVSLVQKNFLEARYDSDISVINEAISILRQRADAEAKLVDTSLADLVRNEERVKQQAGGRANDVADPGAAPAPRPRYVPAPRAPAFATALTVPVAATDSEDQRQLGEVRARVKSLEAEHARRVAEARGQLSEAQTTLGPLHPNVVALKEKVAALEPPPAELTQLQAEQRALVARLALPPVVPAPVTSGGKPDPVVPHGSSVAVAPVQPAPIMRVPVQTTDDPDTARSRAAFYAATGKYNELLNRIDAAEIERDVAGAAFKYKYSIVRPAELPRTPKKPKVSLVVGGGLLATLLLALLVAGIADLRTGRFIEPWQIEDRLKLPILGELRPPEG